MASQAWVAERAIPLLKKKPSMGVRELQEALQDKYSIDINYQTVLYGKKGHMTSFLGILMIHLIGCTDSRQRLR